jgi:hypothetical protein
MFGKQFSDKLVFFCLKPNSLLLSRSQITVRFICIDLPDCDALAAISGLNH